MSCRGATRSARSDERRLQPGDAAVAVEYLRADVPLVATELVGRRRGGGDFLQQNAAAADEVPRYLANAFGFTVTVIAFAVTS